MKFLKAFASKLAALWPWAKSAFDKAAEIAPVALPYIQIAGDIITGLTPTTADDLAWAAVKAKFPRLFDGSILTPDETKLYALAVSTELLKAKFPSISTTVARLAVQGAYTGQQR